MPRQATDVLNIGLMFASLVAAYALPFELFLAAYAVLGPLHYLTELAWLGERKFFMRRKSDGWILGLITVLVLLGQRMILGDERITVLYRITPHLFVLALGFAWVFSRTDARKPRLLGAFVVVALACTLELFDSHLRILFQLFVVTIIHVCIFTGAFILFGALRGRSWTGHTAFAIFVACCGACLLLPAAVQALPVPYITASYRPFAMLNIELGKLFGFADVPAALQPETYGAVFTSRGGIAVMRLIAFAYTYHYLNWFSKTSVIGWHKVDRSKLVIAALIWIASIGLYAIDYELGLRWLLLLSLAHVVFEFPLNHISFSGIASDLFGRVVPGRSAAP